MRPREDEKSHMVGLYNLEEEDDMIDVVVKSWARRLEKGRSIWLEGLLREGIEGKKEGKKRADKTWNVEKVNEDRENVSIMTLLTDLKDVMVDGFAKMDTRVDDINRRLVVVEELTLALSNVNSICPSPEVKEEEEEEKDEGEDAAPKVPISPIAPKAPIYPIAPKSPISPIAPEAPIAPKVLEDDAPLKHYKRKKSYSKLRNNPYLVHETQKRAHKKDGDDVA